jgi:hypothetical protein
MSSSQSTPGPSTANEPAYQLISYQKLLLDALFVTKDKRKPKFVTILNNGQTELYGVSDERDLHLVARIIWEADGQSKHSIAIHGRTWQSDDFLSRSKSFLGEAYVISLISLYSCLPYGNSRSWALKCGDTVYKWRLEFHGDDILTSSFLGLRGWACYETAVPSSLRPPSNSIAPVATFFPLQRAASASAAMEFVVQDRARDVADTLMCSILLLATPKNQWRTASSRHTKETLEHILKSEFTGSLPPYTLHAPEGAAVGARRRDSASAQRPYMHRRPRTAHGTGSLSGSRSVPAFGRASDLRPNAHTAGELMLVEPPPYASRVDLDSQSPSGS